MKRSDMWLTILASVGVGAAAYYTISKSDKPMNKAVESVVPMLSGITNNNGNNNNNNNSNNNNAGNQSNNDSQHLGPHGMS